jgi:protein phosphatase
VTTLRAAGITDPGQVRTQNQDTFSVDDRLVVIADGMGGYAGGEVAAAIAVEVLGERFAEDGSATGLSIAVADANRRIYERGVEPGLEGMGTTLVAAAVIPDGASPRLVLANVGDSRGYLLRGGELRQVTEDHSVAAELVRLGRLDEEEGSEHPGRHVLTRALGVERDVEPDLIEMEPLEGDRLLLCSDGLSNELTDDEILALLRVGEPSDAARALVAAANAHGGLDNITAVVADVVGVAEAVGAATTVAAAAPVVAADAAASPAATDHPVRDDPDGGADDHVAPVARSATGAVATGVVVTRTVAPSDTSAAASPALRPVLTGRERRRRRREDRRARRAHNKWVSLRGGLFLVALAAVLIGGFAVLRWYGTSNYLVVFKGNRVAIVQGQPGGFLWWPQRTVVSYRFGRAQLRQDARAAIAVGVAEPSLAAARQYVLNMHAQWQQLGGHAGATTTTSSTSTTAVTTGGT